ncbi:MAG: OsmC family protein [Alphaproteobacteria bacterium]
MKATATWIKGFESTLDDGFGHKVTVDLPVENGGEDLGASALDMTNMTLAGCVTTIFALMAKKMRVSFSGIEAVVESQKSPETGTIGTSIIHAVVTSSDPKEKVEKCFAKTMDMCPVGRLFEKAGVDVQATLEIIS